MVYSGWRPFGTNAIMSRPLSEHKRFHPVAWGLPLVFVKATVWVVIVASLLVLGVLILGQTEPASRLLGPALLVCFSALSLWQIHRGRLRKGLRWQLIGIWLVISSVLFCFGGVRGTLVVVYPLIVILSGWLLGMRSAIVAALLSALTTIALLLGESLGALPQHPQAPILLHAVIQLICIGFSTLLIVTLIRSYRERLREVTTLSIQLEKRTSEAQSVATDLARAQEVAHIGSWVLDFRSDQISLSPETCRIFGLPLDASTTRNGYLALVHPEDLPALSDAWQQALSGSPLSNEHRTNIKHRRHWISLRGAVEFDPAGIPLRCVGSVQDVTSRKETEDELRIAATAFEAQEGMLVTDAQRTILRVNQAFTRITGYASEDVVGLTPRILKSGRHDDAFYRAMWTQINDTGSWAGEIWNRRKDGAVYPEWLTISAVRNELGSVSHYIGTLTDITQRKANEDAIRHLAFYDPLTRLPNRRLLLDRLHLAQAASARSGNQGALLFLDLDHFKQLNDTRGHDKGDLLLQQAAQRISACVREEDTAARFGGDEFVIMLADLSKTHAESRRQAETVARKVLTILQDPYDLGDERYRTSASIGITLFANHEATAFELLKQADLAMYQAKAAGRNGFAFYQQGKDNESNGEKPASASEQPGKTEQ